MPGMSAPHISLAQQAVAALVRRLADPVPEVADAALEALLEFGAPALEQIRAATADADPDRATRAVLWLARLPRLTLAEPAALDSVFAALRSSDGSLRATAASALGALLSFCVMSGLPGDDGQLRGALDHAHDLLCAGCTDPDPQVREASAHALANALRCDAAAVDSLRQALNDASSRAVRQAAAQSLGRLAGLIQE
jgi:hypothetical protein